MLSNLGPIEAIAPGAGIVVLLGLAGICLLMSVRLVPRAVAALGELVQAAAAAAIVAIGACAGLFFLAAALIMSL